MDETIWIRKVNNEPMVINNIEIPKIEGDIRYELVDGLIDTAIRLFNEAGYDVEIKISERAKSIKWPEDIKFQDYDESPPEDTKINCEGKEE